MTPSQMGKLSFKARVEKFCIYRLQQIARYNGVKGGRPRFKGLTVVECARRMYVQIQRSGHRRYYMKCKPSDPLPFSLSDFTNMVVSAIDNGYCYHCSTELNTNNMSVDHIKALSRGGDYDLSNLRIICRCCNYLKINSDDREFHALSAKTRLSNIRSRYLSKIPT